MSNHNQKSRIDYFSTNILLRNYQIDALKAVEEAVIRGERKMLISIATGSGRTVLVAALCKLLLNSFLLKRILVITDNSTLLEQTNKFISDNQIDITVESYNEHEDINHADVVSVNIQYLMTQERYKSINAEDFGAIIFFNLDRHPSELVKNLMMHFNILTIGILSSPQESIVQEKKDENRYSKFLNLYDYGRLVFKYTYSQAVLEGYVSNPYSNISRLSTYEVSSKIIDAKLDEEISGLNQQLNEYFGKAEGSGLQSIVVDLKNILSILKENKELLEIYKDSELTKDDLMSLNYKKQQLVIFGEMLEKDIIETEWQKFFEKNTWIFGYGLNYLFTKHINDMKLEQVVSGYNFNQSGKRVDALMKTSGLINSLCFIEIKSHTTHLLGELYRPSCWSISKDLIGGLTQIQKTVQMSTKTLATKISLKTKVGDLTGEEVYLYTPKSVLIIGNLNEFKNEHGVNEDKYSSFELFRKSITGTEIITFDELFHRAKYIIENIKLLGKDDFA